MAMSVNGQDRAEVAGPGGKAAEELGDGCNRIH